MTTSPMPTAAAPVWQHPYVRTVATIAAVGLAGFVIGGLTSPAQSFLPEDIDSLANSTSGWTLPVFGLVWLSRLRPLAAAYAGSLAFVLVVEGYGVVSTMRGYPNGAVLEGFFTTVGLFAGLVVGTSAALLRHGSRRWRALAIAPLAADLIGEGVFGLTVISETTSPVYWSAIIVLGAAFTVWQLWRQRPGPRLAASVLLLIALCATAFWAVFTQPVTLLF